MSNLIDTIYQIIINEFSNPQLNVSYISEKMGISTSYIREQVYSYCSMSVQKLIETIRLENAIRLLSIDNSNILEQVRVNSGYLYSKTFREAFKRRLNLTPQEYKNKLFEIKDHDDMKKKYIKILWENTC